MSESEAHLAQPDRPWMMRTYSGHSTARASNELYRTNLARGQTGLSIAFDLPTQTGYDPDDPLARGEVGKVGVPVAHLGHMSELLDGIPPGEMNTSMTINATAAWLLGLYVANAERQGVASRDLRGTTQNDIVKEYLSRGTYIFPPLPSRRLIVDMVAFCSEWIPLWNPMNVCSYHLQEAGATPTQEIAYSLATAVGVLDAVRESGQVPEERFPAVFASISFFVNSGIRFIEETCKMRAFTQLWDRIGLERYGVADPRARRFRYGVQVNSLGLTEMQPENNVQRIVLEMLGVTLSRDARARSIQLPAWNEALGLPRPWDQQWALRMQQVLAYETDLLEYPDVFEGSEVIEARTAELAESATAELDDVLSMGGAFEAIDELKGRLVRSHAERLRRIEDGELIVVGVNRFTETVRPSRPRRSPRCRRGGPSATATPSSARSTSCVGPASRARTSCRRRSTWPTPGGRRGSGPVPCGRCSANTGRRRAWAPRWAPVAARWGCAPSPNGSRRCPAVRRGCWWPSRASTVIRTVPSRSRWRHGTRGWR